MSIALRTISLAAAVIASLSLVPSSADAQRKPKPACGIKSIPFIAGNQWVYTPVAPPEEVQAQASKVAANKPKQPSTVTIKVVSVEDVEGKTEITLEETSETKVDDKSYPIVKTTKLSCVKDRLDVPPQSFFFVGEPGGAAAMEVKDLVRPEGHNSYVFQLGTLRVPEWIENLKGAFDRTPTENTEAKLVGGTLDLQRIVKRGTPEPITTAFGTYDATPVQIELVGSVTVNFDPPEEFSIPANTINKVWIADDVGVVQAFNSNGHMFQLSEATLATK
ncbi:MAG: hypothetical protein Tsb0020_39920 [Haliangiales bacterium]